MTDRSCSPSSSTRPGWTPSTWSAARFEHFMAIVAAALDLRFGPVALDCVRGTATVLAGGGDTTLGLVHLADRCAALPERQWQMAVYEHVASLRSIEPVALAARLAELDAVRAHLKLRLHPMDHPDMAELGPVTGPGPPGLVTTLVVDLGGAAVWVPSSAAAAWPVQGRGLLAEALANTWRDLHCQVERGRVGDGTVVVVTGTSFYTATVAMQPSLLCTDPTDPEATCGDVIVAVPTAHEVMLHPAGAATDTVLPVLAADAAAAYARGPDRLVPDLLRWSVDAGWSTALVDEWS